MNSGILNHGPRQRTFGLLWSHILRSYYSISRFKSVKGLSYGATVVLVFFAIAMLLASKRAGYRIFKNFARFRFQRLTAVQFAGDKVVSAGSRIP